MTPDQAAAKEFYGALFGWDCDEVPLDESAGGGYYLAVKLDGDAVAGIGAQMPEMAGHPAYWGVYLAVDDVDAVAAKVEAAGGKLEGGPFDVMDLGRMAAIQDPTGARVNLWQAATNIGTERVNEPGAPDWNELLTPDVPTAKAFYTEILGVAWEAMTMEGGPDYTCLMVDGQPVAGAMTPEQEMPPHWNVYFNVEDCDAAMARAQELGGKRALPGVRRARRSAGWASSPTRRARCSRSCRTRPTMVEPTLERQLRRLGPERVSRVDPEDLHVGGEERAAPPARARRRRRTGARRPRRGTGWR